MMNSEDKETLGNIGVVMGVMICFMVIVGVSLGLFA